MSLLFFDHLKDLIRIHNNKSGLDDENLVMQLYRKARREYTLTIDQDSSNRFEQVVKPLAADWISALSKEKTEASGAELVALVKQLSDELAIELRKKFNEVRESYFVNGSAEGLLGGTRHLYNFVRKDLGIRMLRGTGKDLESIGERLSRLYESFESGDIVESVLVSIEANV